MRFTTYIKGWRNEKRWTPPPPGTIISFAASTIPNGWLACDGSSVTAATYPALFAAIAYTYGGSGSSFTLPDLRNRTPIGAGTGTGLTARSLAATGGAATVTLTAGESGLASHAHTVTETAHTHTISETAHSHTMSYAQGSGSDPYILGSDLVRSGSGTLATDLALDGTTQTPVNAGFTVNNATIGGSVSTTTATTATSHSNKQPTMTLSFLIKL